MHSTVKYSPLASEDAGTMGASNDPEGEERGDDGSQFRTPRDAAFNFASAFNYNDDGDVTAAEANYNARHNYGSAFTYRGEAGAHVGIKMQDFSQYDEDGERDLGTRGQALLLLVTSWVLTGLSYLFFVLTIPVSYWMLVKKMGEFDRIVVFRLGKMIGVKGPGRFVIFPWMDRVKKIDVRASAFAVPPQQFITVDGGIVEMGAEIQYGIVDVVTMISEVADHQDILRSLGKTLLVKILVKKTVHQLDRDKRTPASEILDEINNQVRKWGINVHSVTLSETKILKQPESGSNTAVGSILKGLGMKDDPKYPTPAEFVRATHGFAEQPTASLLGGPGPSMASCVPAETVMPMPGGGTANVNMSFLETLSKGGMLPGGGGGGANGNQMQVGPGLVAPPTTTKPGEFPANWGRCLEVIINSDFSGPIEPDAEGLYKLEITDTESGKDIYYIELRPGKREVGVVNPTGKEADVTVTISSPDLANVLDGSLAPLQAYLTGRIQAHGDVRKLMFFDKLSKRGHKPGSMFNV